MPSEKTLVMPKLGLTMTEGTLAAWRVGAGTPFAEGDVLAVIESDKVAYDLEASEAGAFAAILVGESETVPVGTPIARWQDGTERGATPPAPAPQTPGRRLATPLARRLAARHGVDLAALAGSGPRGRIQAADVEAAAATAGRAASPAPASPDPVPSPPPDPAGGRLEPPTPAGRRMAARLTAAKRDIPHFYLSADIEVSRTGEVRRLLNGAPGRPRLSMTHMLVAAIAHALRAVPAMNRVWAEEGILSHDRIDVGLAVDTGRGLMSPVVRDLGRDGIYRIARKVDAVVARARDGALRPDDVGGGAITLSNAGMHDVRYMTSIIVPGQSAILGVGAVQDCFRPDAAGAPVLRRELGVVLSADHRVHTGVGALEFLREFRTALAEPVLFLSGRDWEAP